MQLTQFDERKNDGLMMKKHNNQNEQKANRSITTGAEIH